MARKDIWQTKKNLLRKILVSVLVLLVLIFIPVVLLRSPDVPTTELDTKTTGIDAVKSAITSGAIVDNNPKKLSSASCTVQNQRLIERLQDSQAYLRNAQAEVDAARAVLERAEARRDQGQKEVAALQAELENLESSCSTA